MIMKNKKHLILSSLATLLPIPVGLALRRWLPDQMISHIGFNGEADAMTATNTFLFMMPLILLAFHWLCIFFATRDPGNKNQNAKPLTMVLWIIPLISNICCGMMYALTLGAEFSITTVMCIFMGLLFAVIGNYMPKYRMNSTMGIKTPTTYSSEENWNATHRLAGRLWFFGGLLMIPCGLLPGVWGIGAFFAVIVVLVAVPMIYSWNFYRKQKANGDDVTPKITLNPKGKKSAIISLVILAVVLFAVMFTGDIQVTFGEESFTVDATYYSALTVPYDSIEAVELRQGDMPGLRVGGYGSPRLQLGFFENEEFGTYTRYTYGTADSSIVISNGRNILVIGAKDPVATEELYNSLLARISD